jgi:hypothetical protein
MSEAEPRTSEHPLHRPWFQFSLRTLLLLFVVLGSSLAVFDSWGTVVFALTAGLAIYLNKAKSPPSNTQLALLLVCLFSLVALLVPSAHESNRRVQCADNMKQIVMALQAYHQVNGCFPPAYTTDKAGKRMHSWRVLILPYIDRPDLYNAYDFTQPWNGSKNKKLPANVLKIFICPSDPPDTFSVPVPTAYVAVAGAKDSVDR